MFFDFDDVKHFVILVLLFFVLLFLILFCIPIKSSQSVIVGEVYGYDDVEYSNLYKYFRRHYVYVFDGDKSYKVENDYLYFNSEKGDTVSLTYSVGFNCFGCFIKNDLISWEIIESEV